MNKVVTSAGLLALSAAALYGYDPEMTREQTGRPFSVSAVVRGFYDDNVTTAPDKIPRGGINQFTGEVVTKDVKPQDSFGFEVSPSVHYTLPLDQTYIRLGYQYSLRYFEDRDPSEDQTHDFNAMLHHVFSPRHDITVADNLVYSKEPKVVDSTGIITATTRTKEDALHNHGMIDYNLKLTEVWGLGLGYANDLYDYDSKGVGSRSALLDRIEHLIRADLKYQVDPTLIALIGYQLGIGQYTGDSYITASPLIKSDERDYVSHYLYVGADHDFSAKLRGSVRIGGQYTDYVNADDDNLSPYADASLTYVYLPSDSLMVGIRHQRTATDTAAPDSKGRPTLDQEATAGYVQLQHQFTRNLSGSLLGQIQYSTFSGGAADDENEIMYIVGLNFAYRITEHFTAEAGWNYDLLDSDIQANVNGKNYDARSYDRNRVYIGLRATY